MTFLVERRRHLFQWPADVPCFVICSSVEILVDAQNAETDLGQVRVRLSGVQMSASSRTPVDHGTPASEAKTMDFARCRGDLLVAADEQPVHIIGSVGPCAQ